MSLGSFVRERCFRRPTLCMAFLCMLTTGCPDNEASNDNPSVGQALFLVSNNTPFILMDMAPELPALRNLNAGAREHYLMKRAVAVVLDNALSKKQFAGKETFVIRMVLVSKKDEYGRPLWGEATELARFELDRSVLAGVTSQSIDGMKTEALRSTFRSVTFSQSTLQGR
jgi:hypothetical protein